MLILRKSSEEYFLVLIFPFKRVSPAQKRQSLKLKPTLLKPWKPYLTLYLQAGKFIGVCFYDGIMFAYPFPGSMEV
jgi:hypothetical protein